MSNSLELMDFAIGLLNFILNLTDVQVQFLLRNSNYSLRTVKLHVQLTKKYLGLVEMTFAEWDSACYKPKLMARCKTYFLCTLYKFMLIHIRLYSLLLFYKIIKF